eukprot:656393-Pleurochrysis_carterae.AAC.1
MSLLRPGRGRTRESGGKWAARQRLAGRAAGEAGRRRLPAGCAGGRGSGAAAGAGAAAGGD